MTQDYWDTFTSAATEFMEVFGYFLQQPWNYFFCKKIALLYWKINAAEAEQLVVT